MPTNTKSVCSSHQQLKRVGSKRGSSYLSASQQQRLTTFLDKVKLFYRKWHLNHLAPLPFIILFMVVGGFFFWWAENAAEFERTVERHHFYVRLRREFIRGVEVAIAGEDLTKGQRGKLLGFLVDGLFVQLDISVPPGDEARIVEQQEWTFTTAMYFSGTLFTTIGYGDIACETAIGQIGTIVYSFVGIPVMLITLNELGKFLYKCINEFMAFLHRKWQQHLAKYFCKCFKPAVPKRSTANSMRSLRYASLREAKHAQQKEIERKTTHFFKDQRIAQREIVFDFDLNMSNINEEQLRSGTDMSSAAALDLETATGAGNLTVLDESKRMDGSSARSSSKRQQSSSMGEEVPRMHVLVAITFTVSWVLFCAALFKHVEQWTYRKSLYFVCISLLTVGLGDVKVSRRGYMLLFFAFVMIGLSLVSMCINVIQNSIEDFYRRLLDQMLKDYRKGDASKINNSWLAKVLLPLLGKRRRESMMRKIREEAEKSGVEFPPTFEDIFEKPKDEETISDGAEDEETITPRSDFSEIEVAIQPPSESEPEEDEEEPMADMFLGIQVGERRPSFQLDDNQMEQLPYADDSLRLSVEEGQGGKEVNNSEEDEPHKKVTVPQLTVVPFTLIVTDEGEKRYVHSIEAPNNHLP